MKSSFWRRFCRNKGAVFGLIVLMLVALVTVLGPFIAQNNPWDMVGMPSPIPAPSKACRWARTPWAATSSRASWPAPAFRC